MRLEHVNIDERRVIGCFGSLMIRHPRLGDLAGNDQSPTWAERSGCDPIRELELPSQVTLELPVMSSDEEPSCRVEQVVFLLTCSDEGDCLLQDCLGLAALHCCAD